jgi:anti-anti-sigma factor
MAYEIKTANHVMTLHLTGNVDLSETSDIKEALTHEPKSGFTEFEVDGQEIEYIDSSGVAVLLFAKKMSEESGLKFKIDSLSDNATKVIELAGLGSIFKIKNKKVDHPKTEKNNQDIDDIDLNLDNLFQ